MKTILITGSSGFIGRALCRALSQKYSVVGLDENPVNNSRNTGTFVQGNITDQGRIQSIIKQYKPNVIIHCAGVSYQKITTQLSADDYDQINNMATKTLAEVSVRVNPDIYFIFLSSVSVYGQCYGSNPVQETDVCLPNSDYSRSKKQAEDNLTDLFETGRVNKLDILRLAPVYDRTKSLNLEKRVFAPGKLAYVQFGSGNQKISVLARNNLVDFIDFQLKRKVKERFFNVLNVCDHETYTFKDIISVFKKSRYQPSRWTLKIPGFLVWMAVRTLGKLLAPKSDWVASFYDKLLRDSVFDNRVMFETGFKPEQTLKSIFIEKQELKK